MSGQPKKGVFDEALDSVLCVFEVLTRRVAMLLSSTDKSVEALCSRRQRR
jgi:hypothetical protein